MRIPYLKWAIFLIISVVADHFILKALPITFPESADIQKVVSRFTLASSQPEVAWSNVSNEIFIPLDWEGTWVANIELNDLYDARLVVDTGASVTAISESLAFDLGLAPGPNTPRFNVKTANGNTQAWGGRLRSVRVGEAELNNLLVVVQDFSNLKDGGVDGLLGLNFLNEFSWRLDQANGQLILQRKS